MANIAFNYPPPLPVCAYREEILEKLRGNPVVIVCGDTGSGKTTQLPKMALEQVLAEKDAGTRLRRIACTQPRRLAAVTMAERVAAELKCEIGGLVGFRHRFGHRISSDTRIAFMTDGVLLAETRSDPLLRAYGAIIVDEAHERSLNIDFLLGILKRILDRRRDLKVIVSSATLDAERFSAFFNNAPTVQIPGRLFPVEIGYRPPPEDEERDLPRDVADAVEALPPHDDILVFLPGERDIRETAECLRNVRGNADDIIPLLASLPASEQRRAFRPSSRRRIILATNVAETSVTIPGIRAVIDSGLARLSRYVHRTQIQRLQIEPISQASAKQRMGRCGRLGPGRCLRLYSEADLETRDAYTPPEILRTSLAGVILTMLDLRLGDIERFPFLDPPKPSMIREGLRELLELGAIGHGTNGIVLTDIGRKLARIPVEPRLARMLLAASQNATLPSVLPLVASMACDDPRRRPMEEREKADQAHARFRVAGSDFLGTLGLWNWWSAETLDLSQTKARKFCKANYLSYPKMREWRDLTRQLETLCHRLGLSFADMKNRKEDEASAALHRALLAGLLGHIGKWDEEAHNYRGAHGLRFSIHPGSVLIRKAKDKRNPLPDWIVAGELVDTGRLYARHAAAIDAGWLESVAGPICKHSYHSPEWDERSGFVRATEQVTLYGLVIVPARRCDFSRIDPVVSRRIFIRFGLVEGDFPNPPSAVRANHRLIESLRQHAERMRRPALYDVDRLVAHFDAIVPTDICSANALRKWLRDATHATHFLLKKDDWWPDDDASDRGFPNALCIAGVRLALAYRHTPDEPEADGITCSLREADIGILRLWRSDWLVPGLLPEKINWMLGTLPSALRRALAPLDDSATILLSLLKPGDEPLEDAVRKAIYERWGFRIPENVWDWEKLPKHLQMRFRIYDDATGKTRILSRDLNEILAHSLPGAPMPETRHQTSSTTWTFDTIPAVSTDKNAGWETTSHPALCDDGDGVSLKRFADAKRAAEAHEKGVTRLYTLALAPSVRVPFRRCHISTDAALYLQSINYADERIASDILEGAICETLVRNRPEIRSREAFEEGIRGNLATVRQTQAEMTALLVDAAATATSLHHTMESHRFPEETLDSVTTQIAWLLFPGFLRTVPLTVLRHYKRYLRGAQIRLDRARRSPAADCAKNEMFLPYWTRYREIAPKRALFNSSALDAFRWMLEEYRISLFAQELHTPAPISPKRLDAKWAEI